MRVTPSAPLVQAEGGARVLPQVPDGGGHRLTKGASERRVMLAMLQMWHIGASLRCVGKGSGEHEARGASKGMEDRDGAPSGSQRKVRAGKAAE